MSPNISRPSGLLCATETWISEEEWPMITLRCACGERIHADERHLGRKVRCPGCGRAMEIHRPAEASDPGTERTGESRFTPGLDSTRSRRKILSPWGRVLIGGSMVGALSIFLWGPKGPAPDLPTPRAPLPSKIQPAPSQARTMEHPPVSLPTGTELKPVGARKGHGALTVENGTGRDAIVKLVEDITPQRTRRAVYIQSGASWEIRNISSGRYILRFALGTDWDETIGQFSMDPAYSEFTHRFSFREIRRGDRVLVDTAKITLHAVAGGRAQTGPIAPELFEASDAEWR